MSSRFRTLAALALAAATAAAATSSPATRPAATRPVARSIAVLADPHIDEDPEYRFVWVKPAPGLEGAVRQVNATKPAPAEVVVLGDLARRGREGDYRAYLKIVSGLKVKRVRHLLGNHDKYAPFRKVVLKGKPPPPGGSRPTRHHHAWDFGTKWRLIALDSRGKRVAGEVTAAQIKWFEAEATAAKGKNVLVFMHHDPGRSGMTGIKDSRDFLAAVDRHPNVRAILFGHRHQLEFRKHAGRVHLVSAPPTSWPFRRKHPRGWLVVTPRARSLTVEFIPLTRDEPTRRFTRTLTWK